MDYDFMFDGDVEIVFWCKERKELAFKQQIYTPVN